MNERSGLDLVSFHTKSCLPFLVSLLSPHEVIRWTSKEALYKSLYPNYKLNWKDICISKLDPSPKPILTFSEEWFERNRNQAPDSTSTDSSFTNLSSSSEDSLPRLHLSVSHDGEYVIAYVVAETI